MRKKTKTTLNYHNNSERVFGKNGNMQCPCCGNYTISEIFEMCLVCLWEYEESAHDKPDMDIGGANSGTSLNQARKNYKEYGVYNLKFKDRGRKPLPEELPENN